MPFGGRGLPMTIAEELENRGRCYYGLVGVAVAVEDAGPDVVVASKRWGDDGALELTLADGRSFPADRLALRPPLGRSSAACRGHSTSGTGSVAIPRRRGRPRLPDVARGRGPGPCRDSSPRKLVPERAIGPERRGRGEGADLGSFRETVPARARSATRDDDRGPHRGGAAGSGGRT